MNHPSSTGGLTSQVTDDYRAIKDTLLKWLLGGVDAAKGSGPAFASMLAKDEGRAYCSDAIDLAKDVVKTYGVMISSKDFQDLLASVMNILGDDGAGTVAVKRALSVIREMVPYFSSHEHWERFTHQLKSRFTGGNLTANQKKNLISTIGMACRGEPSKLGEYLPELMAYVLEPVSGAATEMDENDDNLEEGDSKADELREFALLTIDTLLSLCPRQMQAYLPECIDAALRYVKYEPNLAGFDTDDDEMQDTEDFDDTSAADDIDDDDEFDDVLDADESDTDDISWKARRAAAKVLGTVITTPTAKTGDATSKLNEDLVYTQIAPTLLSRLTKEKEDAVKVEEVTCLIGLVKRSCTVGTIEMATSTLTDIDDDAAFVSFDTSERMRSSRKRTRNDLDSESGRNGTQFDPANDVDYEAQIAACPTSFIREASPQLSPTRSPSPHGKERELEGLIPSLVNAVVKAWKNASVTLRQNSLALLKAVAVARPGTLIIHLSQIQHPIKEAIRGTSSSSSSGFKAGIGLGSGTSTASVGGLCVEGLGLVGVIASAHARSKVAVNQANADLLLKFFVETIPAVVESVDGKNVKVAMEGLAAIARIEKALVPQTYAQGSVTLAGDANVDLVKSQLEKLFDIVLRKIADNYADSDVRKRAINALGVVLSRTSGARGQRCLSTELRSQGLTILLERLKNELTRVAAIKAIEEIALFATTPDDIPGSWLLDVITELTSQLRKADRALRSSSLDALKSIAVNNNTRLHLDADEASISKLGASLLPLLDAKDLHMLTPALVIYTKIIPAHTTALLSDLFTVSMCNVVRTSISGMTLKAFLLLVRVISEQGAGNKILPAFLKDVGVAGDPGVLGRAIGTILVHGGPEISLTVQDFSKELSTTEDPARKCLALSVLGEVGLRMGPLFTLPPAVFLSNFTSSSDRVRLSAAVALGSSGANNVGVYLPVILDGLQKSTGLQYLLLHSLKEILHHPAKVREEVRPFAETLWATLLKASEAEDNRVVGAECIGRLAMIEPGSYMPRLKDYLHDEDAGIRGTIIAAFRYTLIEQSEGYRDVMRPLLVPILHAMLEDPDLRNHKLALTTVNSAIVHQLDLIRHQLHELVMLIIEDTKIKPELVREVEMGPFRHKVDDGLDLRKAAYEALYASLECSISALNISALYVRLVAGISDHGDIRTLCLLMITKLMTLEPVQTKSHLNDLAEKFSALLSVKQASNAVKQDLEREQEAINGVIRISRELYKAFPIADGANEFGPWKAFLERAKTVRAF
ncbi:hypothetical protein KEM54_001122 [Ascosphaera aggregata]|nr:hypothetical protein KEM54_001122 [Ascosphaera aggregata]